MGSSYAEEISKQKERASNLFKNGLTDEQLRCIREDRILSLLGELNDVEVLWLKYYSLDKIGRKEFFEHHKGALSKPVLTFGDSYMPLIDQIAIIDRGALLDDYNDKLVRLGLLTSEYYKKSFCEQVTDLGKLILRSIDQYQGIRQFDQSSQDS